VGACPEDVDYRARRGLDKALFQSLLTGKWITDRRNLIIRCLAGDVLHRREGTGPCGVGKTWLGCALAQAACRDGVTVVYKRMPRLFEELELAHGPSRQIAAQSPAGQWMAGDQTGSRPRNVAI